MLNDFYEIIRNERRQLLNLLRSTRFNQLADGIFHEQIIPFATYAPWQNDQEFLQTYNAIKEFTLVDKYRCYELWDLAKQVSLLSGHMIEIGVWKGGTGALISKAAELSGGGEVFLCDTFVGVIKAGDKDTFYKGGEHKDTSIEIVNGLLESLYVTNAIILRGIFPEDFKIQMENRAFKFCHIDVDTYGSAKDIFEFIWPRLVVGGVVVFDDYGFHSVEGITRLFNEINVGNGFKIYNLNGHGIITKNSL
jgi:O-methyltransferase